MSGKPVTFDIVAITIYTPELGDEICQRIAASTIGLHHICNELDVSYYYVRSWIADTSHEFSNKYARAKQSQVEHMADELLDIVDDGSNDLMTIVKGDESYEVENKEVVNRSRLRADTRKWLMAKLAPRKYGEKIDVTSDNKALAANIILPEQVSKAIDKLLDDAL